MTMITIFAKTAHTKEGKPFTRFIGRLKNKKGEDVTMTVRANKGAPQFDESKTPYNIEFDKGNANLQTRKYTDNDGNEKTSYTLWLREWKESSTPYIDHSLDDFI